MESNEVTQNSSKESSFDSEYTENTETENNSESATSKEDTEVEEKSAEEVIEDPYLVFKPEDWPEELDFRTIFVQLEPTSFPESYQKNSKKEKKLHNFIINYRNQFRHKFKDRKIPILLPENECGVDKFVSTYINAVKLEHCEAYDWHGIASFVADFLNYVPLIPATEYPIRMLSPNTVIQIQKGTTFEYSTVLCTLLIGAGYDAYIISGYGTRELCYLDRKLENCPYFKSEVKSTDDGAVKPRRIYEIKPAKDYRSKFELFLSARQVVDEKDAVEQEKLKLEENEMLDDVPPYDRLFGLRIHSWILVKAGKRLIEESFFIEPTTGLAHPLKGQKLYNGVESAWNNENYWSNMQDCTNGLDGLSYDFNDEMVWEHILPDDTEIDLKVSSANNKFVNQIYIDEMSDSDLHEMKMKLLKEEHDLALKRPDMTSSWTIPMKVDRKTFESKYPHFHKTIHYKRAIVDHYTEHFLSDGLIMRIQKYSDRQYTDLMEVHEVYKYRKDKLVKKIQNLKTGWITDEFGPGRTFQLTKHFYLEQSPEPENDREIHYDHHIRVDGLARREETPHTITEHYINRPDRLCYRYAEFELMRTEPIDESVSTSKSEPKAPKITFKKDTNEDTGKGTRKIVKIIQRFTRNLDVPADDDVEEEHFLIKEGRIVLKYHRDGPNAIAGIREYNKPFTPPDQIQKLQLREETHYAFSVDPYKSPTKRVDIFQLMLNLYAREEKTIDEIRWSENETRNVCRQREVEQEELKLEISMFDCLRNEETKARRSHMLKMTEEEKERDLELSLDYLAPFLAQIGFLKNLTWEQACKLREDCLDDFKQRLIDKANLIHDRLSKETKTLQQKQQWYMENRMDMLEEDEENYVNFCNNSAFLITTLQLMLSRHKQSAPLKYIELEKRIRKDNRLAILFGNKLT